MAEDELTHGEIARRLARVERDLRMLVSAEVWAVERRALEEGQRKLESDLREGLARVESTSQERRKALMAKDSELDAQIQASRRETNQKIKALDEKYTNQIKAIVDEDTEQERRGTARIANWIAAIGVLVALAVLLANLAQGGGR